MLLTRAKENCFWIIFLIALLCNFLSHADVTNGLVAYLKLDETNGLTAFDATTNGHHAVLFNFTENSQWVIENVELFDVFCVENIPAGQKSVAYAFTYRHAERTLTDAEVNAAHEKLVEQFKQSLKAAVRET
ncbi:MAG: hypothetical protein ABI042_13380 [Verrucomicrobiota bacterium]